MKNKTAIFKATRFIKQIWSVITKSNDLLLLVHLWSCLRIPENIFESLHCMQIKVKYKKFSKKFPFWGCKLISQNPLQKQVFIGRKISHKVKVPKKIVFSGKQVISAQLCPQITQGNISASALRDFQKLWTITGYNMQTKIT